MLYGNLIFIKKTGGDGSKYPVTERDIKIGRSENCLIRIYNPHVALEHCQLIIQDNGQATLRNLSNQNILNGKPLNNGDITLCHGDIFKLGERLARWEYLPTSKFYKQLLSPMGRLVAVVMPQQRSLGDQAAAGTSAPEVSLLKNTPFGKRRFSERASSENSASVKIRKSSGSELIHKGKGDLQKLLTGQHNLKSPKWLLKGGKVKERKSVSGIVGSKTPKEKVEEKFRKSTLPSWKVNIVSPSKRKSSASGDLLTKSNQKSAKSPRSTVQIFLKDVMKSKPEKLLLSDSKTKVKEPQKVILKSNSLDDSVKSVFKKSIMIEKELPLNFNNRTTISAQTLNQSLENVALKSPSKVVLSTPNQNSSLKFRRLVQSESKLLSRKCSVSFKGKKKMSVSLNKKNFTPRQISNKGSIKQKKAKTSKIEMSGEYDGIVLTPINNSETFMTKKKGSSHKLLKTTPIISTSEKSERTPRKCVVNKTLKSPDVKTPKKSVIIKTPRSFTKKQSKTSKIRTLGKDALHTVSQTQLPLINLDDAPSPKRNKFFHMKSITTKETQLKLINSLGESKSPSNNQKIKNKTVSSVSSSPVDKNFNFSAVNSVQTLTSPRSRNFLKAGTIFPRGGRRKLSPSSSAERAAKKLKTSCPKKPDKNKKAALLVLGKANRKQQVSQNVKVLLRQKILKKAIKQSATSSILDDKFGIKTDNKLKDFGKSSSEPKFKKFRKKNKSSENSLPAKHLKISGKTDLKCSTIEKVQDETQKSKKILATRVLQMPPSLSTDATLQSVPKQIKQSEFSHPNNSDSFMEKMNSSSSIFEKNAENYFLSSNRRSSKRLSYKNNTGRPDFIELSPTALGLIPKNIEIFKTPKNKRRSSSLVTPKNLQTTSIIKSASTSKIGNRKNVRFSRKNVSINSGFCSPNVSEKIDFSFSSFDTPNITVDVFVSPLMDQSALLKQNLSESTFTPEVKGISSNSTKNLKSNSVPKTHVRKLHSPSFKKKLHKTFSNSSKLSRGSSASASKLLSSIKIEKQSKASETKIRKSDLNDLTGSRKLFSTPKNQKNPNNSLSDLTGIRRMLRTPKNIKSPKSDLTDVRGVKKLMRTPKLQKSPKNDLTDVRGVKKLMRTPKLQKSPKNDLTDVRGVKKLMRTPKLRKSPKNDLTDVRGVKKLMRTPKLQKSPKNDLTDVRGVKKLMRTPKLQKSPKNDLTDVRGVKKLMGTPKLQKNPKNDLSDVTGVKELFAAPASQKSPENSVLEVNEIKKPLESSLVLKVSNSSVEGAEALSSQSKENVNRALTNAKLKQLLNSESSENVLKNKKNVTQKSHVKGFRAIRGRRTVHSRSKDSKNDLSEVTGVRELFSRHKPTSDYNISLTGVAELFKLTKTEIACDQKVTDSKKKLMSESVQKLSITRTLRSKKMLKNEIETKSSTKLRLRKAVKKEIEKKPTKSKKLEAIMYSQEEKPIERKTKGKMKASQTKKSVAVVKKCQEVAKKGTKSSGKKSLAREKVKCLEEDQNGARSSRKRKILLEDVEISPPKLRRKISTTEKLTFNKTIGTSKKTIGKSETGRATRRKTSLKRVKKVSLEINNSESATSKKQLKTAIKTNTKQIQKVQNKRSQTNSKKNVFNNEKKESPRKTRSSKASTAIKKISKTKSTEKKKVVRRTAGKEKSSPLAKRSARQK